MRAMAPDGTAPAGYGSAGLPLEIELAGQPQSPDNAVAWLYRVVRNKALSAARSAGRRQRHEAAAADRRPVWFQRSAADQIDGSRVRPAYYAPLDPG